MKRKDDSLEWHDENELVRKLDVVEAVLNLADTIDDVVDVIMSVPNTDAPYIDIETGILHWHGWEYRRIEDCRSTADTPQTDCDKCIWSVCNYNEVDWDADTPQTDCYITEDRDTQILDAWQVEQMQTDCGWMYDSRRDYEYDKALDELERNE